MAVLTNLQEINALKKRMTAAENRLTVLEGRVSVVEQSSGVVTPPPVIPPDPPPNPTPSPPPPPPTNVLTASGAIHSSANGQIIEWMDVTVTNGTGIEITHDNVIVRNCRVKHGAVASVNNAHGIRASFCASPRIENCEIIQTGPFSSTNSRQSVNVNRHNIEFEGVTGTPVVTNVRCLRGSRNIYVLDSPVAGLISFVDLQDVRGMDNDDGGNNLQVNHSAGWTIQDFSCKNASSSFTEDCINFGDSPNGKVFRGRIHYNNSPSGDGVMFELGSNNCQAKDVDCTSQGNGAFAAVAVTGCSFVRCRTRDTYNSTRDGRDTPTSNGLSYYMTGGPHTISQAKYFNLANPGNLIYQASAAPGYDIQSQDFVPSAFVTVALAWTPST
jgi:hypothetical protein